MNPGAIAVALFATKDGRVSPVKVAGAATAAWLTIAIPFVANFEGFSAKPYVDTIGTGQPETWCYGETKADGPPPPYSKIFTKAECQTQLGKDLQKYDAGVRACIHVAMPPHREAAMVSAAYNLGVSAVCNGPIARNLNAGNVTAGCNALLQYNHARGVVVAGLTNRRRAEYALCMRDD
jgi:lysozyme